MQIICCKTNERPGVARSCTSGRAKYKENAVEKLKCQEYDPHNKTKLCLECEACSCARLVFGECVTHYIRCLENV